MLNAKNKFSREEGTMTHGSLFSGISEALTSQQSGWDGQINYIVNGTPSGKKSSSTIGRKQKATPTSQKQISLFGGEKSTSSPEDSHVSHTAPQESDLGKKMTVTSGRRCLEQYGRFSHDTLWGKMFPGLLIGMEGWFSTRCKLNWKLKGTKSGRLYFQLVPSTLPTEGTEFGLLPTPCTVETDNWEKVQKAKDFGQETLKSRKAGLNIQNNITNFLNFHGMLPTPTAMEYTDSQLTSEQAKKLDKGGRVLRRLGTMNLLQDGESSRLNPRFVMEMMGFPPDWTELPFLSGETNPSKPEETQSCHK